ncbi:MAG: hypothetical protein UY13_C0002G0431 [Candidatus Pacebacteria bacterium GW2011_GWB1_47_8]|nr:MAG: hypothetical protein UX28_C0001G0578 [Candidatus Pacebacteria bacterium GW2011_GWA1_46_10]KKU84519.1 MAG: hypothetical protein UY13_C0002G0431 [Candidatus Pacebacteria bacterium GW2011_GWB1_47_8]HCR81419.1 hypothetical protein [Candidatus Paceibacterota bacterium]
MRRLLRALYQHRLAIFLIALMILIRFVNLKNVAFFTYDNGRDAQAIQAIVGGDLTLIGPTTGLQGFYLGPLWFYLGVPGYVLSGGNPYGLLAWYMALASLAVPLFWWLSKLLFSREKNWALVTFVLLSLVPGSVLATTFVANPMILLPLLAGTLLAFWQAHRSRLWLMLGFFLLGLQLQAEFAYAIFLVPVGFGLIAWVRRRFNVFDYLLSGVAFGVTLLPQILFELRHQFLMSRFLWQGLTQSRGMSVGWGQFLVARVQQLFWATNWQLLGNAKGAAVVGLGLLVVAALAGRALWRNKKGFALDREGLFRWRLLSIFALTPYLGFLLWRGNYGHFFRYYLTPQFIVLVPLIVLGFKNLLSLGVAWPKRLVGWLSRERVKLVQVSVVTIILSFAWLEYSQSVLFVKNEAGLKTIETAVATALAWRQRDTLFIAEKKETFSSSLLTFTPNYLTAQYDFVTQWQARKLGLAVPYTQVEPGQEVVYVILEPDHEAAEMRFGVWYDKVRDGRIRIRRQKVGILWLETWMKPAFAAENGFVEYEVPLGEEMGW